MVSFLVDGKLSILFFQFNRLFYIHIRHAVSQDESLWRSLAVSYGLHQDSSTLTNKQKIQKYLNQQIKNQLKTLFPVKYDVLRSYTGIADYQKTFNKLLNQLNFVLTFCDDKHQTIWSQTYDTIKFFETSMSIRWLDVEKPEFLTRVHYLRVFSIVSIDINTRPNRLRLPKSNEQLAQVTEHPIRHVQKIPSLLHEYPFDWNAFKSKSISLTNDLKAPVRVSKLPNDDDCLIAVYEQDRSFAFLLLNINYLSFHEQFFTGLRTTMLTHNRPLSQIIHRNFLPKPNDLEVSVFLAFRNSTTLFFRHRFLNCRLIAGSSLTIELVRITDMNKELGPEIEELPKFNWKTGLFKGTISDLFLIDMIVIDERKNVAVAVTLPATLTPGMNDESAQGKDYILSSNVWNFKASSQCNTRLCLNGTIMRLDSEYCALGRESQSWHLQQMTCLF